MRQSVSDGARRLLNVPVAVADANITTVSTAEEFQAALMAGVPDILIAEHLDLSDMQLAFNSNTSFVATALGDVKFSTRAIRVRCVISQR